MKYFKFFIFVSFIYANHAFSCEFDKEKLLSLDLNAFDQDMNGGWRKIAKREGCKTAAANLIREYREKNASNEIMLFWHEGQLRAQVGETDTAIALFEKSRNPNPKDIAGWNLYVDASVAFLKKDKAALLKSRDLLANLPKPEGLEMVDANGNPVQMAWPPNLNIVESFVNCFEKSYKEAYGKCD